jgi:hypothetical protein
MDTPDTYRMLKPLNPGLTCADGFTLSVQASARHYCEPRTNSGPWTSMEVCCDESEPMLKPFAHEPIMCPGIFREAPVEVIEAVIAKHGGLVEGQLPQPLTNDDLCDLLIQARQ